MKRIALIALAAAVLAAPALASSYRLQLAVPPSGKLLRGHGGVEAADDRTATALVRIVTPANDIHEVGTVRVLVMNLSPTPFEFGPAQVTLSLADGTILKPVSIDRLERGRVVVQNETQHAMADAMRNGNNMSGLAEQANSAPTAGFMAPQAATPGDSGSGTEGQDRNPDTSRLPGAQMLDSIYQLLIPLTVEPQKAWGGYYLFEMPKVVRRTKADQALTIQVRTGAEEHRFPATLKWY